MTVLEVKHQGRLREWQERIMECRSSGKSVKTWCQEEGVSATTYYRWEREVFGRVRQRKDSTVSLVTGAPEFAEVPAVQAAHTGRARPMITVRSGGIAVDIYSGADAATIRAIIQAIQSC